MSIYDPQSQRNPTWAGVRLGTVNGITIGAAGCFITSAAMIATHFLGRLVTPLEIDTLLTDRNLYVSGDLYPPVGLHLLFPQIELQWIHDWPGPANLNDLVMADDEERLVSISTAAFPLHALRAYGGAIFDDPWYGDRTSWPAHHPGISLAAGIVRVEAYRVPGWTPPWKRPAPAPAPPPPAPVPPPPPPPPPDPLAPVRAWYASAPDVIKH
jgi:hypothetical protein